MVKDLYAYHATRKQKQRRAARNKSRKIAGLKVGDRREVDHVDNNPLNMKPSNLRIVSRTFNRKRKKKKIYP